MNHSFNKNLNNLCAICSRPELDHSSIAQCECCTNVGDCEIVNKMLMCAECQAREANTISTPEHPFDPTRERIVELLNSLEHSMNIPMDRRSYFVGRITAIVDIENQLIAAGVEYPEYELAKIVEKSLVIARANIVEKQKEIQELQGIAVADQRYLNQLVPKLREEEREKFKLFDINYKPTAVTTPATPVSKPRQSASDKAIESFAKMLGISVEQAKLQLSAAAQAITKDIPCTCSETPGFCKKHPSK